MPPNSLPGSHPIRPRLQLCEPTFYCAPMHSCLMPAAYSACFPKVQHNKEEHTETSTIYPPRASNYQTYENGFNMVSTWFQLVSTWCQQVHLVSTWFQHGFNMVSTGFNMSGLVSTWFQHGFNMVSTWFKHCLWEVFNSVNTKSVASTPCGFMLKYL